MNVTKFYGAPGTGKTRALIGEFKAAIVSGIPADNILCTQFRSEAATDVKPLIAAATGMPENNLKSVRTIHGECLSLLLKAGIVKAGDNRDFLMKPADYTAFNHECHYKVNPTRAAASDFDTCSEDPLLGFYSWIKNTKTPLCNAGQYPNRGVVPIESLKTFYKTYEEYKQNHNKIDFGDMLGLVLKESLVPDCPVQMYDEAQDMTPAMYELSKLWGKEAENVFYAGDPLQTLYPFWGASPVFFLEVDGEMKILPESHRLPRNVWSLSSELISIRTPYKAPSIRTREADGIIRKIDEGNLSGFLEHEFYPKLKAESTVFHLTRTNRIGLSVARILAEIGIPYSGIAGWKEDEADFYNVIAKKRRGETLTPSDFITLVKLSPKNLLYFADSKADIIKKIKAGTIKISSSDFERGLWVSFKEGNPCAKLGCAEMTTKRILGALKAGVKAIDFSRINRVQVMTIHGAKGLEAQNVFVHAAVPPVVKTAMLTREGKENEAYVWYVALTRTKQNLFIVSYTGKNYSVPGVCA